MRDACSLSGHPLPITPYPLPLTPYPFLLTDMEEMCYPWNISVSENKEYKAMTTSELLREKCSEVLSLLNLDMDALEREAVRVYLHQQLRQRQAELFRVGQKYGIKTADDLENLFKKDRVEEKNGWEDYFRLDHLEAEIESIKKALSIL